MKLNNWKLNKGTGTNEIATEEEVWNKSKKPGVYPATDKYCTKSRVFELGCTLTIFGSQANYESNQLVKYSHTIYNAPSGLTLDCRDACIKYPQLMNGSYKLGFRLGIENGYDRCMLGMPGSIPSWDWFTDINIVNPSGGIYTSEIDLIKGFQFGQEQQVHIKEAGAKNVLWIIIHQGPNLIGLHIGGFGYSLDGVNDALPQSSGWSFVPTEFKSINDFRSIPFTVSNFSNRNKTSTGAKWSYYDGGTPGSNEDWVVDWVNS